MLFIPCSVKLLNMHFNFGSQGGTWFFTHEG